VIYKLLNEQKNYRLRRWHEKLPAIGSGGPPSNFPFSSFLHWLIAFLPSFCRLPFVVQ